MKAKRIFAALLCGAMLMTSSCSADTNTDTTTDATDAPVSDSVSSEGASDALASVVDGEIRDITSMELISELTAGWNLGNTLDATGGMGVTSETSWGNPTTTKEMMDTVKEAGFDIIRIPVTWTGHLGAEDNIDPEWMDRVQEVVDYTIDEETYVILNLHHEEWNYPFYDNEEAAVAKMKKIWGQIAERFKDYDEHLIFEGQNEPRHVGTANEWGGGTEEGWAVVNATNAAFVETVRAGGGNNAKRHLMIPGYCATSDSAAPDKIAIPEGDDKIIVSVHAYLPYTFALSDTPSSKFSSEREGATRDINTLRDTLKKGYIDKGIAVIIGETGARNKDNLESRIDWAKYYTSTMRDIGVTCVWWDNGAFSGSGEKFGLLHRQTLTWMFPEIVEAFVSGGKGE
ncbi:MAG: glycoside hydrolase family 5 protein [Ruminiclostridium sp.]|nr:glycoside hydrolase family 5 protein [Ruminiclostridium sp.]